MQQNCSLCKKDIEYPHELLQWRGRFYHRACFQNETATSNIQDNPQIKLTLRASEIYKLLNTIEKSSPTKEDKPELQQLYQRFSVLLSEKDNMIDFCKLCKKPRYRHEMYESKKIGDIQTAAALKWLFMKKRKVGSKPKSILRFCSEACAEKFTAKVEATLKSIEERVNMSPVELLKKQQEEVIPEKPFVTDQSEWKLCVECNNHHATFQCQICDGWLGAGSCGPIHSEQHLSDERNEKQKQLDDKTEVFRKEEEANEEFLSQINSMPSKALKQFLILLQSSRTASEENGDYDGEREARIDMIEEELDSRYRAYETPTDSENTEEV